MIDQLKPTMADISPEILNSCIGKTLDEVVAILTAESDRIVDERLEAMIPGGPFLGDPMIEVFRKLHEGPETHRKRTR